MYGNMFSAGFLTSPCDYVSLESGLPNASGGGSVAGVDGLSFSGVTVAGTVPDLHRIPFSCSAADADRCITETEAKVGAVLQIPYRTFTLVHVFSLPAPSEGVLIRKYERYKSCFI